MGQTYVPYAPILAQSKANLGDSRGGVSPHYDRTVERLQLGAAQRRNRLLSSLLVVVVDERFCVLVRGGDPSTNCACDRGRQSEPDVSRIGGAVVPTVAHKHQPSRIFFVAPNVCLDIDT
jgi:hypothetical protein